MATALRSQRPTPGDSRSERFTNRQAPHRTAHLQPVNGSTSVRNSQSSKPPLAVVSLTPAPSAVRKLPTASPVPNWLRLLIQAQRGSLIVTFALVIATLMVYGGTVYMQQLWSKEYRKLKTMQRSERQMLAASEVLKIKLFNRQKALIQGWLPNLRNIP